MNREKKLGILKTNNPFISSSVGDPWKSLQHPDVKSVNKNAFDGIRRLIGQKISNPALECTGLVLGEVGSGKTHLIGRILKEGEKNDASFSFAYVQPIEDPAQTFRYLLREVTINLCRHIDPSSNLNQLDKIIMELFKEALKQTPDRIKTKPAARASSAKTPKKNFLQKMMDGTGRLLAENKKSNTFITNLGRLFMDTVEQKAPSIVLKNDKIHAATAKQKKHAIASPADITRRFKNNPTLIFKPEFTSYADKFNTNIEDLILKESPEIHEATLNVLLQYRTPSKRRMAQSWLKGNCIDEKDAKTLSVPSRNESSNASLEYEAREILNTIGVLLGRYHQPLVICFDRLENLETDAHIHALGKMVEFLNDRVKTMLPIVFVRGQSWMETFSHRLNQHVISRLTTNQFELEDCTSQQAIELIETRLARAYGKNSLDDLYPFTREELLKKFKPGRFYTPRTIISLANAHLRNILGEGATENQDSLTKLRREFNRQLTTIKNDFESYQPDSGRLRRALEICLTQNFAQTIPGIKLVPQEQDAPHRPLALSFRLEKPGAGMIDLGFIIDVEQNNNSVRSDLKRGLEFLKTSPSGIIVYIRENRSPIPPPPRWQATNELLDTFVEMGGNIVLLNEKQAAFWYALALLVYTVKEGDITLIDENNHPRPVPFEDLLEFVKEEIHNRQDSGFDLIYGIINKSIQVTVG